MPQDTASLRFLLVEDEAMIAMLVEDMLEDLGHELVTVATRLDDALEAAGSGTFDLAILDLSLGGVLTYPVADALAAQGIPFLFATGYGSGGLKEAYAGRATLQKPFDQKSLEHAISAVLEPGS